MAEEYTVIDRNGRIQLPKAHVEALDLRERVRLDRRADHVGVWPGATDPEGVEGAPARRGASRRDEEERA